MAQVTVTIAGKTYRMACGDGEEAHLEQLGRLIDGKIEGLKKNFGEIGDQRIIVMTALTLADELVEAQNRLEELEGQFAAMRDAHLSQSSHDESWSNSVVEALGAAAERIERVAKDLA